MEKHIVITSKQKNIIEEFERKKIFENDNWNQEGGYSKELFNIVKSEQFKKWFGDWENNPDSSSKIIDENGFPLIVSHSTNSKFDTFDMSHFGKSDPGMYGAGFYFMDALENHSYGNISMAVFLNVRKPFYTDAFNTKEEMADYLDISEDILTQNEGGFRPSINYAQTFNSHVREKGHDGIVVKNGSWIGEIIVFNPNQVKSVRNQGFDEYSDNIYENLIYINEMSYELPGFNTTKLKNDYLKSQKKLYEGLITSYPIENVIKFINKSGILNGGKIWKESEYNTFENTILNDLYSFCIVLEGNKINEEEINKLMDSYGYYQNGKINIDNGNIKYSYLPKFDVDVSQFIKIYFPILYHVTLKQKLPKIMQQGLCPKDSNNQNFKHPSCVFLSTNKQTALDLFKKEEYGMNEKGEYVLLSVHITETSGYKFFFDQRVENAVYTYDNIHPQFITVKEEFTNENNMKKKIIITTAQQKLIEQYEKYSSIKEDRNQLQLPFDNQPQGKPNYLHFIDFLESVGKYGTIKGNGDIEKLYENAFDDARDQYVQEYQSYTDIEYEVENRYPQDEYPEYYDENGNLNDNAEEIINEIIEEQFEPDVTINLEIDKNRNLIHIYREITLPPLLDYTSGENDFYLKLKQQFTGAGIYWSWDKHGTDAYWGSSGGSDNIIMYGLVSPDNVNWIETIRMNGDPTYRDEREIRVFNNASIEIYMIIVDKTKQKLPLQSSIIVPGGNSGRDLAESTDIKSKIKVAEKETNTNPSDAQIDAENYKKGKVYINGFRIAIEQPKGSTRSGTDKNGKKWSIKMNNTYGYFLTTTNGLNPGKGQDGDQVDVFLGNKHNSKKIFVIDQFLNGKFDESKVFLLVNSKEEAESEYLKNYEKGWKGLKYVTEVNEETFKDWLYDRKHQMKPFAHYKDIKSNKINEINLPKIEIGDEIKIGRFKNKKATIEDYYLDNKSQPKIKTNKGDKKVFNFNINEALGVKFDLVPIAEYVTQAIVEDSNFEDYIQGAGEEDIIGDLEGQFLLEHTEELGFIDSIVVYYKLSENDWDREDSWANADNAKIKDGLLHGFYGNEGSVEIYISALYDKGNILELVTHEVKHLYDSYIKLMNNKSDDAWNDTMYGKIKQVSENNPLNDVFYLTGGTKELETFTQQSYQEMLNNRGNYKATRLWGNYEDLLKAKERYKQWDEETWKEKMSWYPDGYSFEKAKKDYISRIDKGIEDYLKNIGRLRSLYQNNNVSNANESLEYYHVTDASPESDEYKILKEGKIYNNYEELLKDKNVSIVKKIGEGNDGSAYLLDNNMVLKYTTYTKEAALAQQLLNKNLKHFVNIYEVGRMSNNNVYYILMEYVSNIDKKLNKKFDEILTEKSIEYRKMGNDTPKYWNNFNRPAFLLESNFINFLKNDKLLDNDFWNIAKQFIDALNELISNNIFPILDFHYGNFGFTEDGTLKLFDHWSAISYNNKLDENIINEKFMKYHTREEINEIFKNLVKEVKERIINKEILRPGNPYFLETENSNKRGVSFYFEIPILEIKIRVSDHPLQYDINRMWNENHFDLSEDNLADKIANLINRKTENVTVPSPIKHNLKLVKKNIIIPENKLYLIKNILKEALSSIVYHFTSLTNFYEIAKHNEILLSSSIAKDAESKYDKGTFFLSLTRQKNSDLGYTAGWNDNFVRIEFDGDKLNQNFKGEPMNYWGASMGKDYYMKRRDNVRDWEQLQKQKRTENEDRLYSNNNKIQNIYKYIKRVDALVKIDNMYRYIYPPMLNWDGKVFVYDNLNEFNKQSENTINDNLKEWFRSSKEEDSYMPMEKSGGNIINTTLNYIFKYMATYEYLKGNTDFKIKEAIPKYLQNYSLNDHKNLLLSTFNTRYLPNNVEMIAEDLQQKLRELSNFPKNDDSRKVLQLFSDYVRNNKIKDLKRPLVRESIEENIELEVDANQINLKSFEKKDELNPKLFQNDKLNSKVRLKLLEIADDFVDFLEIPWTEPRDIVLVGSNSGYNWSKYSDIDLHIVYNFNEVSDKTEFVQNYFDSKKSEWNDRYEGLKIYGYPIELYVENFKTPATSNGRYSLEKNEWLQFPSKENNIEYDKEYVKQKSAEIMTKIDDYEEEFKNNKDSAVLSDLAVKVNKLWSKIKNARKEDIRIHNENGIFNMIFKVLRRSEYLQKLYELKTSLFVFSNSLR